ncbi:MAG: Zn-binding domain-containing protein, partial [Candidatus Hodarchaeales archaeon]
NLRGIGETVNVIVKKPSSRKSTSSIITTREIGIAIQEFYPGAIALVNGKDYAVRDFNKNKREVTVVPVPRSRRNYFTKPKVTRMIIPDKQQGKQSGLMFLTDVVLITSVESYTRTNFGTYASKTFELDEPLVHEMTTRGLLIRTAPVIDVQARGYNREAWHGLGHLIISFSALVIGTRGFQDIECDLTREYLLFHEITAGGRGISRALMKTLPSILVKGLINLEACSCSNGCPKCLYIHGCREKNKGLSKDETLSLGRTLLEIISSSPD